MTVDKNLGINVPIYYHSYKQLDTAFAYSLTELYYTIFEKII